MASLRFPFLFSQPTNPPNKPSTNDPSSRSLSTVAMAGSVAAAVVSVSLSHHRDAFLQKALEFFTSHSKPNVSSSSPLWGSISLAGNDNSSNAAVESKTGVSFPTVLNDTQTLLGIGLRKKSVFGLKNIDVYAFGVYADDSDIKDMCYEKYGSLSVSELKENKAFHEDIMDMDISMTVRLQVVYGKLSIKTVRSSFEESIGSRLQKYGGADNKDVLQRFTSFLKDEIKLPRGSVIDLSRERGHILRTTINGADVGKIQSKPLCRAILDLYIGEDPFDAQAKKDTELNLASLLLKFQKPLPEAPLQKLACLKTLSVVRSSKLQSFPTKLENLASLKTLTIRDCEDLGSLKEEELRNLKSLEELKIINCESMASLSISSSSSSASTSSPNHLPDLKVLEIDDCPKLELPIVDLELLISLQELKLFNLPQLTYLPDRMQHVTTLQSLVIQDCVNLKELPEWLLKNPPPSLRTLYMAQCHPELHRRCEKDKGEDWHKISHLLVRSIQSLS